MGIFSKKDHWTPPERPHCSCAEHAEDLMSLVIPNPDWDEDPTLEQLLGTGSLDVQEMDPKERFMTIFDEQENESQLGPLHWMLGAGDEIYGCYEDDAVLPFDDSLRAQPGIEIVEWYDREEFYLGAPTLCREGVLAAVARALEDPRVRTPGTDRAPGHQDEFQAGRSI